MQLRFYWSSYSEAKNSSNAVAADALKTVSSNNSDADFWANSVIVPVGSEWAVEFGPYPTKYRKSPAAFHTRLVSGSENWTQETKSHKIGCKSAPRAGSKIIQTCICISAWAPRTCLFIQCACSVTWLDNFPWIEAINFAAAAVEPTMMLCNCVDYPYSASTSYRWNSSDVNFLLEI